MDIDMPVTPQEAAVQAEVYDLLRVVSSDPRIKRGPRGREYRLRSAAVGLMLAGPRTSEQSDTPATVEEVHDLLRYDREHRTSRGAVPADDPRWDADPAEYVRQEYRAWRAETS